GTSRTDVPPTRPLHARAPGAGEAADDASASRTDIEIIIAKPDRDPTSGRFTVALRTPHDVDVPDDLPPIDLGKDPQTFAKTIIDEMLRHDRTPFADTLMKGIGLNVARQLPRQFWAAFDAVARHVRDTLGRVPTVLLLASENLVPWELAALPSPLYPDLPPYLAAQTSLGRWILDAGAVPLPPATTVPVKRMAALVGHYAAESGLQPLPHAVEEAQDLEKRFGALTAFATADAVSSLLDAAMTHGLTRGGAEVIHFAGHGEVDPRNPGSGGLFLDDGMPLHPMLFASTLLGEKHQPFLFLNACMVGAGGEMLGDAAGFPGQCLGGGFRGMVAPLWAVRDTVARQIAVDFYDAAFGGDGRPARPLGEVLREIRGRYAASAAQKKPVPTYLAYVLYGHPGLVLSR
ncbi:MAG: CHAT domain-containing protein, partial [Gemmatirosa sp.]